MLWHFYHCYAAGHWQEMVTEHCEALTKYGLYDELDGLFVGFVGSDEQIDAVRSTLDVLVPKWREVARAEQGWEQVTLDALYTFVQDHDGYVSYAHTKGASRIDSVDRDWRRCMEFYNIVQWCHAVKALENGKTIAGCHWIEGQLETVPGFGHGGMFGGNYWWTKAELLRQNCPPSHASRMHAEHWLGQLSEVMPITPDTIEVLCPTVIYTPSPDW